MHSKKKHMQYTHMSVKKSTFYLTGHEITLRSDHLPLKKFLRKMTLNNTVNNRSTEISGKANILADTLSRLIDTNPDLKQHPEVEGHEFSKYCFETLPKVRLVVLQQRYVKSKSHMTILQIWSCQWNYHWRMINLHSYKRMTWKFGIFVTK